MKRAKNAKPIPNQRSISSFFTLKSSPARGEVLKNDVDSCSSSLSSPANSGWKPPLSSSNLPPVSSEKCSSAHGELCPPESLSEVSSPTKKRKRETLHSDSPEIIALTPQTKWKIQPNNYKRLSLNLRNSAQKKSSVTKNIVSCESSTIQTAVKELDVATSNHQSKSESNKKNASSTPRKEQYDISSLKSPVETKVSPRKSCDKTAISKNLLLSPTLTEDDKVPKSLLQNTSPLKPTKASASQIKFASSKKLSHLTSRKGANIESDKLITNLEEVSIGSLKMSANASKDLAPLKKMSLYGKGMTKIPSKKAPRKCLPTQSASETPELIYPALNIRPKILKPKSNEGANAFCEVVTPSKPTANITSSSKKNDIGSSPVRRSPRKHPLSPTNSQDKNEAEIQNSSEELKLLGKENKTEIIPAALLRRSPRKHSSSTAAIKTIKFEPSSEAVHKENVSKSNDIKPQTSYNKQLDEFDDICDVFQDDYDDVLSYMANMNEDEFNTLDLSDAQLCEVVSIAVQIPVKEVILTVKSIENQNTTSCRVRGCWLACPVSEGDSISLQAVKSKGEWLLDNTQGFLVLYPDTLISGTTVVGSLFCARRSVLGGLFRGLDSDSPIMVIGSIVHELFQMVLQQEMRSEAEVKQLSEQLITSRKCVQMLYSANMTMAQMQKELSNFVPRIVEFVERFVDPRKAAGKDKNSTWLGAPASSFEASVAYKPMKGNSESKDWNGKIIGIRDIEETLWEPKLGIKGMVDVSVEVKDLHGIKKVMPLELKTGRASFSAEHCGQVTLYTMMMSKRGQNIESGLLLYLREGQMQEISVSHNERKDLIQLRNTLAHFLKPRVPVIDKESGQFVPPRLPEPISFKSACQKCPYATLCSVFLMKDGLSDISTDHPMVSVSSSSTQHLMQTHIDYVLHWVGLLLLEDSDQMQLTNLKHIWRVSPKDRERSRQAIANLQLLKPGVENGSKYCHTFTRQLSHDLRETGLSTGDSVLISTDKRIAIERGNILDIDSTSVKVSTNRNLFDRYANETFHLDLTESNTVLVYNLTNLGCLLDNNESAERLRKIVIDRAVPSFSTKVDKEVIQDCLKIFKRLDNNQRNALLRTLKADSHLLIRGLPGTGKTTTMVALVELLVRSGLSILITSHTHSAVDNLLLRLKKVGLKFLRLGPDSRIHPQLLSYSESSLTKNCKSPEDLYQVYNQQQIIGVTCLGAGHSGISQRRLFDVCLVDESTQVLQPSILRPLFSARRFVLVGDPDQLPPLVKSHKAQELGLSESLFARLDSEAATVSLTLNYRMNQVITDLANSLTYEGKLKCGNDKVANSTLQLTSTNKVCANIWLAASLSTDIEKSVVFIDTFGVSEKHRKENVTTHGESSCTNQLELALVIKLLNAFVNNGVSTEDIGVMAPYRAQVSLLTQAIKAEPKLADIEVNTVDQFQGRDKDVVVYSCTRSNGATYSQPKEREILNDKRRLTVAITRAKYKLVLLGHSETLKLYAPFNKLLSCISSNNIVPVDL